MHFGNVMGVVASGKKHVAFVYEQELAFHVEPVEHQGDIG